MGPAERPGDAQIALPEPRGIQTTMLNSLRAAMRLGGGLTLAAVIAAACLGAVLTWKVLRHGSAIRNSTIASSVPSSAQAMVTIAAIANVRPKISQ